MDPPPESFAPVAEQMNPFSKGTVAFYIACFCFGIFLSRIAHHLARHSRFNKFRRYPMEKKIGQLTQVIHTDFGFLLGPPGIRHCMQEDLEFCENFLRENFPGHTVTMPENVVCVWIPRQGFKCGKQLQEFNPIEGKMDGSFLTYQMTTERAIVTFYNLPDRRHFVAGLCIYPRLEHYESGLFRAFPIEEEPCQRALEKGYDYVPPKPKKLTKRRAERIKLVIKAARDAGILMPHETLGGLSEKIYDNPSPPPYTALLMEEGEEAKE